MGDAIMAFFGAPLDQPDHHVRACRTAIGMIETQKTFQQKWKVKEMPLLESGIGINSGLMVVGNMGSDSLFDYTVIGDNVNLGSRLEGLNKQYGTNIIISESTYHHVKDAFAFRELDLVQVMGKEEAVAIYELMSKEELSSQGKKSFLNYYTEGLKRFREREWQKAVEEFRQALTVSPDDITTRLYIKRCEIFSETPPPDDWDGSHQFKTK
jgi:adenylate cyclase